MKLLKKGNASRNDMVKLTSRSAITTEKSNYIRASTGRKELPVELYSVQVVGTGCIARKHTHNSNILLKNVQGPKKVQLKSVACAINRCVYCNPINANGVVATTFFQLFYFNLVQARLMMLARIDLLIQVVRMSSVGSRIPKVRGFKSSSLGDLW